MLRFCALLTCFPASLCTVSSFTKFYVSCGCMVAKHSGRHRGAIEKEVMLVTQWQSPPFVCTCAYVWQLLLDMCRSLTACLPAFASLLLLCLLLLPSLQLNVCSRSAWLTLDATALWIISLSLSYPHVPPHVSNCCSLLSSFSLKKQM